MLLLSLAACGGDSGETSSAGTSTEVEAQQTEAEPTESTAETREKGEKVDANGKILRFGGVKVTVWLVGDPGKQDGVSRMLDAMNQYFLDEWNINAEFHFRPEDGYGDDILLKLTNAEECDIFCSGLADFQKAVCYSLCYDLYDNNLIQTYGQDILKRVNYEFLNGCEFWGGLYGVPSFGTQAVNEWCIAIATKYLIGGGIDLTEFDREGINAISVDHMSDIFATLRSAYPDISILHPGTFTTLSDRLLYDAAGGDSFGVLLDPANSLEITNLFESEAFANYCATIRDWETRGYISPEAKAGDDTTAQIIAGRLMADTVEGTPDAVFRAETARNGLDTMVFSLGEAFVHSDRVISRAWSIDSFCEHPEAAMTVLNAFYGDTYVKNLLYWGVEDKDYAMTPEGFVTYPKNVSKVEDLEYYRVVTQDQLPCTLDLYVKPGQSADCWNELKAFNEGTVKSKAIGFVFDRYDTARAEEYIALTEALKGRIDGLMLGRTDIAAAIGELNSALYDAGLGDYMNEKQAQLEDWAARTGIQ